MCSATQHIFALQILMPEILIHATGLILTAKLFIFLWFVFLCFRFSFFHLEYQPQSQKRLISLFTKHYTTQVSCSHVTVSILYLHSYYDLSEESFFFFGEKKNTCFTFYYKSLSYLSSCVVCFDTCVHVHVCFK